MLTATSRRRNQIQPDDADHRHGAISTMLTAEANPYLKKSSPSWKMRSEGVTVATPGPPFVRPKMRSNAARVPDDKKPMGNQQRQHHGKGDRPEPLPAIRAVNLRRLVEILGDALQPRQENHDLMKGAFFQTLTRTSETCAPIGDASGAAAFR